MVREIPLTKGYVALVDDEDFERVNQFKWHVFERTSELRYAERYLETNKNQRLHRFIMDEPVGVSIDHRNGDGLDCQRANIRVATRSQNQANQRTRQDNATGFKGVSIDQSRGRFRAVVTVNGVRIRSRYFKSPEEAARVYDDLARMHFGEFARLNFPQQGEQAA